MWVEWIQVFMKAVELGWGCSTLVVCNGAECDGLVPDGFCGLDWECAVVDVSAVAAGDFSVFFFHFFFQCLCLIYVIQLRDLIDVENFSMI